MRLEVRDDFVAVVEPLVVDPHAEVRLENLLAVAVAAHRLQHAHPVDAEVGLVLEEVAPHQFLEMEVILAQARGVVTIGDGVEVLALLLDLVDRHDTFLSRAAPFGAVLHPGREDHRAIDATVGERDVGGRVDDVERPALGFLVDARDVVPDDADRDERRAREHDLQEYERRPALHGRVQEDGQIGRAQEIEEPGNRQPHAGHQAETQREPREGRDAGPGEPHHRQCRVVGSTRGAFLALERERDLLQSQPRDQAAHEAVLLAEAADRDEGVAAEQPEIADFRDDPRIDRLAHDPVEQPGGEALVHAVAVAGDPLRRHDVESLVIQADHVLQDVRRILQVGVHDDDGVALGEVHPRRQRHLVAEVAAEADDFEPRVLPRGGRRAIRPTGPGSRRRRKGLRSRTAARPSSRRAS